MNPFEFKQNDVKLAVIIVWLCLGAMYFLAWDNARTLCCNASGESISKHENSDFHGKNQELSISPGCLGYDMDMGNHSEKSCIMRSDIGIFGHSSCALNESI